jgi:DNA repair protein RadC
MSETNVPITQWSDDDKPREKLLHKGATALSDSELLAILINTGTKKHSAVELSKLILAASDNSLDTLARKSLAEFQKIPGIGEAKAITIAAALELGRRREIKNGLSDDFILNSDAAVYNLMAPMLRDLNHEEFWLLLCYRSGKLLKKIKLGHGSQDAVVVDIKRAIKEAIDNMASAFFLVHNHPSGSCVPSVQDKELTRKMVGAASMFNIKVIDHIIIGGHDYYSFLNDGLM